LGKERAFRVDINATLALMRRGGAEIIGEKELTDKLKAGQPLKIKYGADPSSPDLHLGHTVVLRKLRQLQDLGHKVQFLIGDFTGMIGDPTGRSITRPPLTPEQIQANAKTYQEQVFKILLPEQTEIFYNSHWCNAMNFSDVIRLAARYTVARIMERDDFSKRFQEGRPIGLHEFLYPLIQGYDSVVLHSDVEFCGTDQIFNCLVARALQQDYAQIPEAIVALPLLEGLDGVQKMSKSLGNYIGITDSPKEMFGKVMSIPDGMIVKYFELLTPVESIALEEIKNTLNAGQVNPKDVKIKLACQIVTQYHGAEAAEQAAEEFDRIFRHHELPASIPTIDFSRSRLENGKIWIIRLIFDAGLVASKSEAQRMVAQGAVNINQEKVVDATLNVAVEEGLILQVGKRKFTRLHLIP
jgi:tyrosyl-tRNA synthetase